MTMQIFLKPRRAKPFFMRHPWVFSGAVERVEGTPDQGDIVAVRDASGAFIGQGFFNPKSQIIVRLLSWSEEESVDDDFFRNRLAAALRLRSDILRLPERSNAYRLVYSDSDGIPGLIVDRYADYLVAQFHTAGIYRRRDMILDALHSTLKPRAICERSDAETLEKEGLPAGEQKIRGEAPASTVEIAEGDIRLRVDLLSGQKTGFFLDQRENRLAAARYAQGRTVLDAFCYTGGFGCAAARMGAASVTALDRSEPSLQLARKNLALNGMAEPEIIQGNAAEEFRRLKDKGRRFGLVILDPPKFARSRAGVPRALSAYRDINLLALQLLEPDGILVSCSCSGHVTPDEFLQMLNEAALEAHVSLQTLERRSQSPDHPVLASCLETAYLKCVIARAGQQF